jgi:formiminoglutamase
MKDVRWGDLILQTKRDLKKAKIVLIGFPTDVGVARNGGRIGAAHGPDAIRQQLNKLTPHVGMAEQHQALLQVVCDYGDIPTSEDLEVDQTKLAELVDHLLSKNMIPIVLGGGHETTYGHALGYMRSNRAFSVLNIDAHTDVRPLRGPLSLGHSGSPFRQLLDTIYSTSVHYAVMGVQYHSVAFEHVNYIYEKSGECIFRDDLSHNWYQVCIDKIQSPTLLTIDLDVLDQAFAPGVSAPNMNGITPHELYQLAYYAGMNPYVLSVDVVELNPTYDIDHHTARIAALIIWWFTVGYLQRDKMPNP